jgi:hypothetical protein
MRWVRGDKRREYAGLQLWGDERGTVTAEFAIVLPAVVVVLGLVVGGILLASHRITLVSLAAEASRAEARGDDEVAAEVLARIGSEVDVRRSDDGMLHCITLSSSPGGGLLSQLSVAASACAATSGAGE